MSQVDEYIIDALYDYLDALIEIAREELRQQGHRVTGETEKSFESRVIKISEGNYKGVISANLAAVILNFGVTPARVPYEQGSGKKTSLYISALLDWAANVKPELDEKERKSFVFAVARKAKKEGHPTRGSFKFSKNSRRVGWFDFSIELEKDKLFEYVKPSEIYGRIVDDFQFNKRIGVR
jgi:hypothetical protein